MENVVAQRIKHILTDRKVSITALSKRIGMQQVTCNRQLRGDQVVSLGLIDGVLDIFPDISAEWLLRGDGEMLRQEQVESQQENVSTNAEAEWKIRYEELEKRYNELLSLINKKL